MATKLPINPDRNDELAGAMMQAGVDTYNKGKATNDEVKPLLDRVVRVNSVSRKMQGETPKGSKIHHDNPVAEDLEKLLAGELTVQEVIKRSHETTEMTDKEHKEFHERQKI